MKNTADFLDALRVKLDVPSDYALGAKLGMHRQQMSRYRTLQTTFDDEASMRIADILEIDPAFVVASMHAQRAKRSEEKKLWERIATSMAGVTVILALVAILPTTTLPTWDGFNTALHGLSSFDNIGFYATLNIHYAYFKGGQGGTVCGTVADLTISALPVAPSRRVPDRYFPRVLPAQPVARGKKIGSPGSM